MCLLKILGERGVLKGMVEKAKKRVVEQRERERGSKKAATTTST